MLKKYAYQLLNGFAAGFLISIGGAVFLNSADKVVGAFFFATALLCICYLGFSLYTGKICYIAEDHSKEAVSVLLLGLLGNLIATVLCGIAIRYAVPSIGEAADEVCYTKLTQPYFATFIRGIFCGALVYLSVAIFREKNTPVGIIFCIPTFILSGFEHSIADMFYFGASDVRSFDGFLFIMIVVAGNSVGGLLLPLIRMLGKEKKA